MKKIVFLFVSLLSLSYFKLHSAAENFITIAAELEDWDVEITMDFAPMIYSYIPSYSYVENNKIRSPYLTPEEEIDALAARRGIEVNPENHTHRPMFVATNTTLMGGFLADGFHISIEEGGHGNFFATNSFALHAKDSTLFPIPIKLFLGTTTLSLLKSPNLKELKPSYNFKEDLTVFVPQRLYVYIPEALLPSIETTKRTFSTNLLITLKAGC